MIPKKTLLLFDANALLHRAWHALPPTLTSPDGKIVNAVYGFSSMIMKALDAYKPTYAAACFDRKEKTFRHELSAAYKATREKKPDELYEQIAVIKEVLAAFKIPALECIGYEADDLLGTLAASVPSDVHVLIVTGDQDAFQLVTDRVHVLYLKTGISDLTEYDPKTVEARYGFAPRRLIDYKALRGDVSDNIAGVAGIGEKTATELIKEFGTVEEIFAALKENPEKVERIAKARGMKALVGHEKDALDAKKLTTIVENVPCEYDLSAMSYTGHNTDEVKEIFRSLGFKSLLTRLGEGTKASTKKETPEKGETKTTEGTKKKEKREEKTDQVVTVEKDLPAWVHKPTGPIALLLSEGQQSLFGASVMFTIAAKEGATTLDGSLIPKLKPMLGDASIAKITCQAKELMHVLVKYGVKLGGIKDDVALAGYLVEAGTLSYDLDTLLQKYLKKNRESTQTSAANDLFALAKVLREEIEKEGMMKLYEEIELPLIPVLFNMEQRGICVDVTYLEELSKKLTKRLEKIEKEIIEMAGVEFNVNSPIQLAEVLFERMKLPSKGLKRTKTGISTAAPELEKIEDAHPIIEKISEQRELAKLLSTYIDALPSLIGKDGRIHTTFQQFVTSTGRLSSANPNLQNIPIQSELGNEIRKAFVAPKGYKMIAADYSQIQLRIAASLSRDKHMMEAFKNREDIHTATAARVFGVPPKEVTSEMRRQAKVINFGILYGMGANALARGAGMSVGDARQFIAKYFEAHPGIRMYMEEVKLMTKAKGYAETPFGRRRRFPEINSGVPQLQASAERMAMNMPIQGTEADIMKIAMLRVAEGLEKVSKESRLLLQVHDELVLEVPDADVKHVAEFLKETMESVTELEVPILVNVEVGRNWGEMEEIE